MLLSIKQTNKTILRSKILLKWTYGTQLNGILSLINIDSVTEWKRLWILISWLRQKPADLDLQRFQNVPSSEVNFL